MRKLFLSWYKEQSSPTCCVKKASTKQIPCLTREHKKGKERTYRHRGCVGSEPPWNNTQETGIIGWERKCRRPGMEGRLFTFYSLQIPCHVKVLLIQNKQTNLLIKVEYNKKIARKHVPPLST